MDSEGPKVSDETKRRGKLKAYYKTATAVPCFKFLEKIYDVLTGAGDENWSRVVMVKQQRDFVKQMDPKSLSVLEISGDGWSDFEFGEYRSVNFPEYNLCDGPLPEKYDFIIAEQVFEHLRYPGRAIAHVLAMLKPGGCFLVSTPLLIRLHHAPEDCTRWTEVGLKYFLIDNGFPEKDIQTGAWGNRACVEANFRFWRRYRKAFHSLKNEPDFPYHVWAFAKKDEQ